MIAGEQTQQQSLGADLPCVCGVAIHTHRVFGDGKNLGALIGVGMIGLRLVDPIRVVVGIGKGHDEDHGAYQKGNEGGTVFRQPLAEAAPRRRR